jgi:hypothetical protein
MSFYIIIIIIITIIVFYVFRRPIPLAAWCKAWVCDRKACRNFWTLIQPVSWMFVSSVVCYQVEVPAMGRSLVQRNPTECGVINCV